MKCWLRVPEKFGHVKNIASYRIVTDVSTKRLTVNLELGYMHKLTSTLSLKSRPLILTTSSLFMPRLPVSASFFGIC